MSSELDVVVPIMLGQRLEQVTAHLPVRITGRLLADGEHMAFRARCWSDPAYQPAIAAIHAAIVADGEAALVTWDDVQALVAAAVARSSLVFPEIQP